MKKINNYTQKGLKKEVWFCEQALPFASFVCMFLTTIMSFFYIALIGAKHDSTYRGDF